MRITLVVVAAILCFAARGTRAQSFEQQVQQISQSASGAALRLRRVVAASQTADALDETMIGAAARFVFIEPGEFEMGSPRGEPGRWYDEIQHPVKLTKGYEMQATAVTQLQYVLVVGRNPSTFRRRENCDADNFMVVRGLGLCAGHPVENVSWEDAQAFIAKLNKIQSKYAYRLPTEAEWENAARAGMPSGFLNDYAWYGVNSGGRTHAVATKKANPYGFYDMNGNVWQWVNDWYGDYPAAGVKDPVGPASGEHRVIRGGSWDNSPEGLRSAGRNFGATSRRGSYLGFRLVRSSR